MPPFAVNIVALVSFASSWSIGHGLSSLLTPAKKTVNSAFDDLLPVFEKDDDGSDLYDAIHQNYVIETPTEEDIKTIIGAGIDGKESTYFADNHFTLYGTLTGIARISNEYTVDVSSCIYGKFTGSTESGQYISIAINLHKFRHSVGVTVSAGALFHSTMGFSVEGNKVNWQGITEGSPFTVGMDGTSVTTNLFRGLTKGLTENLSKNEIGISVSTLGVYKFSQASFKYNSTYLGLLGIGELPFQSIKLDFSDLGANGTFFLNSSFQEDGSVDYYGDGNITQFNRNFPSTLNLTEHLQLDLKNPYSKDSIQYFFNTIYFGEGIFIF